METFLQIADKQNLSWAGYEKFDFDEVDDQYIQKVRRYGIS